ncbi:MAG: MFS transporter [Dehalococcoidia bacterium]|nr:MFS transporter [Dehalococcoidia bacterium]
MKTSAKSPKFSSTTTRKPRFYYGWVIVWSMFTISIVTTSMGAANLGFFIKPMKAELGLSQADFGWMNTARMLAAAVSSVAIGRILDKHGPRVLLSVIAVLMGGGLVLMGFINSAWQAIFIFAFLGLIGSQGGSQLITTTTPAKWFKRKRPQAIAYVYVGIPLGIVFAYPLTQWLIDAYGWNVAWIVLGVGGMVIMLPISALLLRRAPEDMGLNPDGATDGEETVAREAAGPRREELWTRGQAMRTPAFWALTVAFGVQMFVTNSVNLFRITHFQEHISDRVVSYVGPSDGLSCAAMALCAGALVIKIGVKPTVITGFLLLALNFVLVIYTTNATMMFLSSAAWGVSLAILGVIQSTIWADYYGRDNLGSIRGVSMLFVMGFAATGPPLAGYMADLTGGFAPMLWIDTAMLVAMTVLIALTPAPRKRMRTV